MPGERITLYGVEARPGALTLGEKLSAVGSAEGRRRVPPSELVASDELVDSELVRRYRKSREWEGRPLDAVRTARGLVVVDGHHRLAAATAEGAAAVPVRVLG